MKVEQQVDQIITSYLPAVIDGKQTLDSVLASYPQLAAELKPRLEAALWLHHARLSFATRPGYIIDSRKYLVQKINSLPPISPSRRIAMRYTPQRWVFNITAPIIVLLLLALVINSAIFTARLSIPGDPLYPVKLMLEDAQIAFTFDRAEKTDLHFQHTRERTLEFVALVIEGDYDYLPAAAARMETEIIDSLHQLNNLSTDELYTEIPLASQLSDMLSNEIVMLNVLKASAPPSSHPGINLAIQVAQSGVLALR